MDKQQKKESNHPTDPFEELVAHNTHLKWPLIIVFIIILIIVILMDIFFPNK